jgi:hypothetical protein
LFEKQLHQTKIRTLLHSHPFINVVNAGTGIKSTTKPIGNIPNAQTMHPLIRARAQLII